MTIRVNDVLKQTRNPLEYGITLYNKIGSVVHKLDDGYWLIEFSLSVVYKGKKMKYLQWYIHELDLTVIK